MMRAFFNGALCVGLKIKENMHTHTHALEYETIKYKENRPTTHCIHNEFIVSCVPFFAISAEWPTIIEWPNQFIFVCIFDQCKLSTKYYSISTFHRCRRCHCCCCLLLQVHISMVFLLIFFYHIFYPILSLFNKLKIFNNNKN